MKLTLITLIFAIIFAFALSDDYDWKTYKAKYNKSYADLNEDEERKQIFFKNIDKIYKHNQLYAEGKATFTMGINQFSDWREEELKRLHGSRPLSNE